jgi:hypothetical protein
MNTKRRLLLEVLTMCVGSAVLASNAFSQIPAGAHETIMIYSTEDCVPPAGGTTTSKAERSLPGANTVRGQPYSAVGRSVMTTTLANGNRIVRSNTTRYYRDSQGRTRTEHEFSGVGPFSTEGTQVIVTIQDPVAKQHIFLHPRDKRADIAPLTLLGFGPHESLPTVDVTVGALPPAGRAACIEVRKLPKPVSLGERMMEGLRVIGSRSDFEIPAGEIGNEYPLAIGSEQWFSPELGIVVASTHSDPLIGETVYKLEGIQRKEPDAALFAIPKDFARNELPVGPGEGEHIFIAPAPAPLGAVEAPATPLVRGRIVVSPPQR